jgi:methyl-accepting chemotaxis protein
MSLFTSLARYLPSAPGSNRRRLEELAEEIRQVRQDTRRAQEKIADAIVPLARVSEHFPLLRRELDEFVQGLSVTLRQASDRIREVDDRLDELMEQTRMQSDALGMLQTNLVPTVPPGAADAESAEASAQALPATRRDSAALQEQVESLRAAVDRLSVAATRTETLVEELLDRPQEKRDLATWYLALLAFGFAALGIALATMAYLR